MSANINAAQAIEATVIPFPAEQGLTNRQLDNRIRKLDELKRQEKEIKKAIEAVKQELIDHIGSGDGFATNHYEVKYTRYSERRIDSKKLKADFEEVYMEYSKEYPKTRLSYKAI